MRGKVRKHKFHLVKDSKIENLFCCLCFLYNKKYKKSFNIIFPLLFILKICGIKSDIKNTK